MYNKNMAHYHLPGLFEFYELYRLLLPIYSQHREYFYEWCDIGSIYGAPVDCIWGGGRVEVAEYNLDEIMDLLTTYGISGRLTFSNSLLKEEHLQDGLCNKVCRCFHRNLGIEHGVIVHSDILANYIREQYPGLYLVSSTTKVLTKEYELMGELEDERFRYVVPDFRWNNQWEVLEHLSQQQREKVEFLCNECCDVTCMQRKECYVSVSRKNLGQDTISHECRQVKDGQGYRFSKAMRSPAFISIKDIQEKYLQKGFSHYKIEGRGLGSAMVLEFILYYMVKPEYQINLREELYLDSMLDLF